MFADEKASDDSDSAGLCEREGGHGVDERDAVVRFSSLQCLVKVRVVLSSTPMTLYVSYVRCRRDARRVRLAIERALPLLHGPPVMQHLRVFAKEGELFERNGHIGGSARGKAAVVTESVAWVGLCKYCGVSISGGGTGAIAYAADRGPSEKWFEEAGE
jgi:hypothetical protein